MEGSRGVFTSHGLDPQETQLVDGMTPLDPLFGSRERCHGRVLTDDGETDIDFKPEATAGSTSCSAELSAVTDSLRSSSRTSVRA